MFSRLNQVQLSTLNNDLISLIESHPEGIQFFATPGEGVDVLAKVLIRHACGDQIEAFLKLPILTDMTKFLHNYFALGGGGKHRPHARQLTKIINTLIVDRKLKMTIDHRYKRNLHTDSERLPLHIVTVIKQ